MRKRKTPMAPVSALPALPDDPLEKARRFKLSQFHEAAPEVVISPEERARVAKGLAEWAERLATRSRNAFDKKYARDYKLPRSEPIEAPLAKVARLTQEYQAQAPVVGPRLAQWIVANFWPGTSEPE